MMLTLNERKPYKVYVKKLENGFGLKTVNTSTGVENVFVVTSEAIVQANNNLQLNSSKHILQPILSKFSKENVCSSESLSSLNNNNNIAINKVLSHLEPYLRELKSEILGFHVFQDDNILPSENIQKTSIIFVTNTKLAKEKGVHVNIPGKLINTFCIKARENSGNHVIEADPVVKPLTIVVGDYVLHINICFDLPPIHTSRTTATQTRKLYTLTSSIDNDAGMVYNIEPLFNIPSYNKAQDKETQTENCTLIIQSTQTNFHLFNQDGATQTESVILHNCGTSTTELDELEETSTDLYSSQLNIFESDEDDFQTVESLLINRSPLIKQQGSQSTFKTFESHTNFLTCINDLEAFNSHHTMQDSFSNHIKKRTNHSIADNLRETIGDNESYKRNTPNISSSEESTYTIFENCSNFKQKPSSSNLSQNIGVVSNFNAPIYRSSVKSENTETNDKVSLNTIKQNKGFDGTNKEHKSKSSDNVSVKEIKQHLNEATVSLNHLYSVVELLEELSTKSVFQESREKKITSNLGIVESRTIYSGTIKNGSATVELDTQSKYRLCDRCGLFYSTAIPEGHNCDEYITEQTTNSKSKNYKPQKNLIMFQKPENDNLSNSEKLLTDSVQNYCNNVHGLKNTLQKTGVHIKVVKGVCNRNNRPASSDTLMEVNITSENVNNENNNCINDSASNTVSDSSSNFQKDSFSQDQNNERDLCNNEKMNKYQNGIEEIIRIVSLKGEKKKTAESSGSIIGNLPNSDCSKRNSKFFVSTLLQQIFTNKSDLTNAISPKGKRKLFHFQGRRQDKSLTGFKTKAFSSCNKLKLEEGITHSEPNTQTKQDHCLVTTSEGPSSTDIGLIASNYQYPSGINTSTMTLHIIPSSCELLQKPSNIKPVFELRSKGVNKNSQSSIGCVEKLKETSKNLDDFSNEFGSFNVDSEINYKSSSLFNVQRISSKNLFCDAKQDGSKECIKRLYNNSMNSELEINTKKQNLKKKSRLLCFPI